MGRAAFAFRDLDEELQTFVDDESVVHVYQSHSSPPALRSEALKSAAVGSNLSDSMVLKRYVEHNKAQRRRKLLGGALFVGAALLGALPMLLLEAERGESPIPMDLPLAVQRKALRTSDKSFEPLYNTPQMEVEDDIDPLIGDTEVGDPDVNDGDVDEEVIETLEQEQVDESVNEATIIRIVNEEVQLKGARLEPPIHT